MLHKLVLIGKQRKKVISENNKRVLV